MRQVGYYNGEITELQQLKVPALDRALYFGDGVYDFTLAYGRKLFALEDHLERFLNSCRLLRMDFPLAKAELAAELQRCVDVEETGGAMAVYWQSSRGCRSVRRHDFPPVEDTPSLLITVMPAPVIDYKKPLKLCTVADTRFYHCHIKTLNLIPNVQAVQHAEENGCDEVVFHRDGRVTEGAHSALLILKDGHLLAPPLDELILPSVTRKHLYQLADALGIPAESRVLTLHDVETADEVIVGASGKLVCRAEVLDGRPIGGKDPTTYRRLQQAYFDRVQQELGWVLEGE